MTTGTRENTAPDSGAQASPAKDDAYVDRLADRISANHDLPEHAASPTGPAASQFPAMHESSDVHTLPNSSDEDEALDVPPPPPEGNSGDAFAEFEDEIEGENTRIDDSQLLAEQSTAIIEDVPVQPFLGVERGNDEGREFVLQEGENGVGRGIDNDVILADVAVSRRHLIVIREGDVLRLRDLGSGNGTQVNGKKVSNVVLTEGDRIELGETVLVVRTPGGVRLPDAEGTDENHVGLSLPPPAPFTTPSDPMHIPQGPGYQPELTPSGTATDDLERARPVKNAVVLPKPIFIAILFGGSLLLAMLGAAVAILLIRASTGSDDEVTRELPSADAAPFDQGVQAYRAHRWDEAEAAFREAVAAGDEPRANDYLARTRQAREHQQYVDTARAALERGDPNAVLTQTASVPPDSPLATEAAALRERAQARQVTRYLSAAREAHAAGNEQSAEEQLALAHSIAPDNDEVRALTAELHGAGHEAGDGTDEAEAAEEDASEDAQAGGDESEGDDAEGDENGGDATPGGRRSRRPGRARASNRVSTQDIITAYLAGHFDQAARLAHAAAGHARGAEHRRLDQLAGNIERFGRLYGRARAAHFGPSVRSQMEQAISLDRHIARASRYRDSMRGPVVDAYLQDAQRRRSQPADACSSVRHALAVDANNVRARQMGASCETRARSMMSQAAHAPASRAMSIYGDVLLMVPRSSPLARDATERLRALRRRRVVDEDE